MSSPHGAGGGAQLVKPHLGCLPPVLESPGLPESQLLCFQIRFLANVPEETGRQPKCWVPPPTPAQETQLEFCAPGFVLAQLLQASAK